MTQCLAELGAMTSHSGPGHGPLQGAVISREGIQQKFNPPSQATFRNTSNLCPFIVLALSSFLKKKCLLCEFDHPTDDNGKNEKKTSALESILGPLVITDNNDDFFY